MFKLLLTIFLTLIIIGCGGGGGNTSNASNNIQLNSIKQVGYLIDSPVVNMPYSCGGENKKTTDGGRFECSSLPVTFRVGNLKIATVNKIPEDKKVYIQDIVGVSRDDVNNENVVKLALLIQSLDDDGNISKEIFIKHKELNTTKTSIDDMNINEVKELLSSSGIEHIVTEDKIKEHLLENLHDNTSNQDTNTTNENNDNNQTSDNSSLDNNESNSSDLNSSILNNSDNNTTQEKSDNNQTSNDSSNNNELNSSNSSSNNEQLTIAGSPKTTTHIYDIYQFKPNVNRENVTFSIKNKPSWAEFDSSTGLLQGAPMSDDNGTFANIKISATFNGKTVSLSPFSIKVLPAVDLAYKFGKATQGTDSSYYYYEPAYYAIDHNDSTYNHTSGGSHDKNWLQIELLDSAKIEKIVIQNRDGFASRLTGAKVYISNKPYSAGLNSSDLIYTLQGVTTEQVINLPQAISGKYIIIKGEHSDSDNRHIHLRKVEVYGQMPQTPKIKSYTNNILISNKSANGVRVIKVDAIDFQNDSLTYTIIGDVPFGIDSNGSIYVNGNLDKTSYSFIVKVSDGINSTTTDTITINVTPKNAIQEALKSGKVDRVTKDELLDAILQEIESLKSYKNSLLQDIYQNNSIAYEPGKSSQVFEDIINSGKSVEILQGSSKTLALAGEQNGTRYLLFGSQPYSDFASGNNLSYKPFLNREFLWLIGGLPIDSNLTTTSKTIAYFSLYDENAFKDYINSEFHSWDLKKCSDYSALNSCIDGADLIVFGKKDSQNSKEIESAIDFAINRKIATVYFHSGWSQNKISQLLERKFNFNFPYGGNWWSNDKAEFNSYVAMDSRSSLSSIKRVITHFKNRDYNFNWNRCKDSSGNYGSKYDNCSEVPGLRIQFLQGANKVKGIFNKLDEEKIDIFTKNDFKLQKLLALLGDKLRQNVHFPMDKTSSDDNEFLESLFADYSVYNYRKINPVQPDMGNFSRSDFSSITPINKTISLVSKTPFRAAGVYVLPGKTVKITRLDSNSSVVAKVFVNSLRSGSTHEYAKKGYKRPKFLQSAHIEVRPNESIYFTSPYGGPLQIAFNRNGANVSFKIENVGQHPVWSEFDSNPNKDSDFEAALLDNKYDWAEIITSAFEVHSTREKMLESINNFRWGSTSKLAEATKIYASSHPMALAGYKGPGIETIDDIKNFAILKNIPIYDSNFVKHMNADQATCGYGCSGNPYDAYWAFDPIGHGDIHEIGHSLERAHFRLKGWELHSSTNTYAFYTQMRYNMYVQANGLPESYYITNSHESVKVFKEQFNALQNCANDNNKTACMKSYWDGSNYAGQALFIFQAMYQAQKYATGDYSLSNGLHLIGRLHILDRYFYHLSKSNWDSQKDKLGLSSYSFDEARAMSSNDWLVISLSWATGIDYRPFFDMYGQPYSTKASSQIDSFGFSKTTKNEFFVVEKDTGFILPNDSAGAYFNKQSVPIDGSSTYPY